MNNTEGKIWYSLGLDNSKLQQDANQAKGVIKNIGDSMVTEGQRIDRVYNNISRGLAFVFTTGAVGGFVSQLIKVRGEVQQLEITFEAMLNSKSKADKLMNEMMAFASNTPFELKDVGTSARMLLSVGESAENIIPTLKSLGDVAAGTGVSMERLILNYTQVKNKGTLSSLDLKDFLTAGVPIIGELAKNLNVAEAEIKEMVSAGKIGFAQVEKAFKTMSEEGGKFNNLMAKQSQSVKGAISGLQLEINKVFNEIGKSSEGVFTSAISEATDLVKNYKSIGKTIAELIAIYGTYKTTLLTINAFNQVKSNIVNTQQSQALFQVLDSKQKETITNMKLSVTSKAYQDEVRKEIQANLSAAQVAKSKADTELASATKSLQAKQLEVIQARALETQRKRELIAIQSTGTAKQIETAQRNLAIASQQRENAIKQRGIAIGGLNTARINSETASKSLNTLQTNINTASNVANTKASGVLAVAKLHLRNITTQLNATMLANPYVLVGVAVAGLTYGLYKLATQATSAEKALKEFNEEQGKIKQKLEEENNEIQNLLNTLKNENNARELRTRAYHTLIEKYPSLFAKYQTEMDMLRGIEEANKAVALSVHEREIAENKKELTEAKKALEQAKNKAQQYTEQADNLIYTSGAGAANSLLAKQQRDEADKQQAKIQAYQKRIQYLEREQAEANFNRLSQEEKKAELLKLRELQKRRNNATDQNVYSNQTGHKRQLENLLINTSEYEKFTTGNIGYLASILEKQITTDEKHVTSYVKNSKVLFKKMQEAKKHLEDIRNTTEKDGLTDVQISEEVKKRQEAYESAKKAYEDFINLGDKKGSSSKEAEKTKNRQEEIAKAEIELSRLRKDNELKAQQKHIEALEEGFEKERALIEFHYKEKAEAIDRAWEDTIIQLEKQRKEGTITASQFDAFVTEANNTRLLGNKINEETQKQQEEKLLKELLDKYKAHEEEKTEITKKFNQERKIIEEKLKTENSPEQIKKLKNAYAQLNKEEKKALDVLLKKQSESSEVFKKLFSDFSHFTNKQLNEMIAESEKAIEKVKENLDLTKSDDIEYLDRLNKRLDELKRTARGSFSNNLTNMIKGFHIILNPNTAPQNKLQASDNISSGINELINVSERMTSVFDKLGDDLESSLLKTFAKITDGIQVGLQGLNTAIQINAGRMSKGEGWISAISAGVGFITNTIGEISARNRAIRAQNAQDARDKRQMQEDYNLALAEELRIRTELNSSGLTHQYVNRMKDGLKSLSYATGEQQKKIHQLINEGKVKKGSRNVTDWGAVGNTALQGAGAGAVIGAAIGSAAPIIGSAIGFVVGGVVGFIGGLFKKKRKQEWSGILHEFPELVQQGADGLLHVNKALLENLKANNQLDERTKEIVQNIEEWNKQIEEANKKINDIAKEIVTDLGDKLRNSLVDAFKAGENAAAALRKVVSSLFEDLGAKLIFDALAEPVIQEIKQDIIKQTKENGEAGLLDAVGKSARKLSGVAKNMHIALEQLQKTAKDGYGLDILKNNKENQKGQVKGFQSLSQETGSELSGRFSLMTELQRVSNEDLKKAVVIAEGIKESTDFMKDFSARSLQHLANIDTNTGRLAKIETDISKMSSSFEEIKLHGLKMK